ncbi:MAG TPA: efflux RND transporter periplasmic adaptor subunit [Gammaproteobacteria bacterium]
MHARRSRIAASAAALVAGCGGEAPQAPIAPPPPEVSFVVAEPRPIQDVEEVPGRVQAYRTADVRARVDGIVERRLYDEGSNVEEGQELFLIDPREMRAAVNAARAAVARAEAEVENARQEVERFDDLLADRAVSEQEYDAAVARLRTAEAGVAEARAELERAELDLSFTTVTAPISGRAGRAQVTEGALVSAAEATLLTRIEQLDPIYVNFSASSGELLEVRRQIAEGALRVPELTSVRVTLILEDGSVYPHEGRVDFLDLSIDVETGTAALRAEFPNPDWLLLPGQFVRARVVVGVRPDVTLVPQRAVLFSEQGASVMVVGPEDQALPRLVELGEMRDGQWAVLAGLEAGDRVIVDGLQRVQPGQRVVAEPAADVAAVDPRRDADAADAGPQRAAP